jgi:hypothetical protein
MTGDYTRQHYIPELLQRQWSKTMPDGKIEAFRLDLPGVPSTRYRPKYTGYENNLWSLTQDKVAGMDRHAIEKHLWGDVDNRAARVLHKMLASGLKSLTPEDRLDWVTFIMSLRLRQPDLIRDLKQDSETELQKSLAAQPEQYEELTVNGDPPSLEEWTELHYPGLIVNVGLSFLADFVGDEAVRRKIFEMKWWLWDFSGTNELLLSDNPCIFTKHIDDPDVVIALPLSPTRAFMATKSDKVAAILRKQNRRQLAMRLNESSVSNSRVRIYARNETPRRFILNRVPVPRKPEK